MPALSPRSSYFGKVTGRYIILSPSHISVFPWRSIHVASGRYLFTSEAVSMGHPDKLADQISDGVLDALIAQDPFSRVACETMVTTGMVVIAGEITTKDRDGNTVTVNGRVADAFLAKRELHIAGRWRAHLVAELRANPSAANDRALAALELCDPALPAAARLEALFGFYLSDKLEPRSAAHRMTRAVAQTVADFESCFEGDIEACLRVAERIRAFRTASRNRFLE
jgi:hypothetical protein